MLTAREIRRLFDLLDQELSAAGVRGELYLVGGAVMCLAYSARPATRDVDALFIPPKEIREAAARVAIRARLDANWLNDAAKGFFGDRAAFTRFLELVNLTIMVAQPEYLLAMKCLAMRIGEEFSDESDVRYLLRYLNVEAYPAALEVITRFYPVERFPQKTLYALEEILEKR